MVCGVRGVCLNDNQVSEPTSPHSREPLEGRYGDTGQRHRKDTGVGTLIKVCAPTRQSPPVRRTATCQVWPLPLESGRVDRAAHVPKPRQAQ